MGNGNDDKQAVIFTRTSFNKPENCFNYSLCYFEVKCIFEGELNKNAKWMVIGLCSLCSGNRNWIRYFAKDPTISNEKCESFKIDKISWNNNDIFGCGLVYPPTNKMNEFPYVFFTQNGKQIGKCVRGNATSYKPYICLKCCSIEANFGNDLDTKPFRYDIYKHSVLKEFY
ncbi:unnamed protein product [Meloidogyne enterolobii]|uniref:Uncharacterized protein n=3 Tax=Meloidogyne enterolobii TaxID=390850 RepID=A0ACB0YY96_MELEN|nr:unnamed protein product [Meloidogyne enterolobii]